MANIGVAPFQEATEVGRIRKLVGDVSYVPLDPPIVGFGDFARFSDAEITGFYLDGGGSTLRAAGLALLQLATAEALVASQITQDDLRVSTEKRSTDLRLIAESYFLRADAADRSQKGDDSFFDIYHPVAGTSYASQSVVAEFVEDPANPGYLIP